MLDGSPLRNLLVGSSRFETAKLSLNRFNWRWVRVVSRCRMWKSRVSFPPRCGCADSRAITRPAYRLPRPTAANQTRVRVSHSGSCALYEHWTPRLSPLLYNL